MVLILPESYRKKKAEIEDWEGWKEKRFLQTVPNMANIAQTQEVVFVRKLLCKADAIKWKKK